MFKEARYVNFSKLGNFFVPQFLIYKMGINCIHCLSLYYPEGSD